MGFPERLRELRKRLGLSQKEFAEKLGVHLMTISRYERGKITPSYKFLELLEKTFNVNPEWLLKGKGEPFLDKYLIKELLEKQLEEELEKLSKIIVDKHLSLLPQGDRKKLTPEFIASLYVIVQQLLGNSITQTSYLIFNFVDCYLGYKLFKRNSQFSIEEESDKNQGK